MEGISISYPAKAPAFLMESAASEESVSKLSGILLRTLFQMTNPLCSDSVI